MFLENSVKQTVRMVCTEALVATGIIDRVFGRKAFSAYDYMFTPRQLIYFTQCLSETRDVRVAAWRSVVPMAKPPPSRKFMEESKIIKDYYAIDTFRGFVPGHVDYEVQRRSKNRRAIATSFVTNKKKWFDSSLNAAGVHSVASVECDATKFDFDHIGPIAFAFLDVDLYVPMIDILPKVYRNLSAGGILLIDDCKPDERWDGALAAYGNLPRGWVSSPKLSSTRWGSCRKR